MKPPGEVLLSIDAALVVSLIATVRAIMLTRERVATLEGAAAERRHLEGAAHLPRLADLEVDPEPCPAGVTGPQHAAPHRRWPRRRAP